MTKTLAPFDSADFLDDAESVAAYLGEYIADKAKPGEIIAALGRIARAKGMAEVATKIGVGRESLYKSLSENGNPSWATVVSVLNALGLAVSITPARPKPKPTKKPHHVGVLSLPRLSHSGQFVSAGATMRGKSRQLAKAAASQRPKSAPTKKG